MSEADAATTPVLPGEPYQVPPHESWFDLEKWVWHEIASGRIADLNEGLGKAADPKNPEDWRDGRRRLASRFLEDLLLREPYRSRLHRKGVRIEGAWFDDAIDLSMAELARTLWLARCRFEKVADLRNVRTPATVFLGGSAFTAPLYLEGACIDADLSMHDGAEFTDVVLRAAKVGGEVSLDGANVTGMLAMDSADIGLHLSMCNAQLNEVVLRSIKVGGYVDLTNAAVGGTLDMSIVEIGNLFMCSNSRLSEHRAEFKEVILRSAKIGGLVDLTGARVVCTLDMGSADIRQHLFMSHSNHLSGHRSEFTDVVLRGAKVGGQVGLDGASVTGLLAMDSADIGGSLFMRSNLEQRTEFDGNVDVIFARIGSNLDLRGAVLPRLDLTGTEIGGELRLASIVRSTEWKDGGKLVLRNASVDAIQDTDERGVWPSTLDLDGFTYRRLGGRGVEAEGAGIAKRGSRWFIEWLAKGVPYTPQPYQQCAKVLRERGHPDMANDVLYAGRDRERKESWHKAKSLRDYGRSAGLWLLQSTVGYGYGYRYFRSLRWVLLLTLLGVAVSLLFGINVEIAGTMIWSVKGVTSHLLALGLFSLDLLLPIIELHKPHYDVVLDGFAKYYFVAHKLCGYVLASFLIAGLAGLTK